MPTSKPTNIDAQRVLAIMDELKEKLTYLSVVTPQAREQKPRQLAIHGVNRERPPAALYGQNLCFVGETMLFVSARACNILQS